MIQTPLFDLHVRICSGSTIVLDYEGMHAPVEMNYKGLLTTGGFGIIHAIESPDTTERIEQYIIKELIFDQSKIPGDIVMSTGKEEFSHEVHIHQEVMAIGLAPPLLFAFHCTNGGVIGMARMKETVLEYVQRIDITDDPHRRLVLLFSKILVCIKKLHTLHIMHNDMHLENMMLDSRGRIYFIDFGKSIRRGSKMYDPWFEYLTAIQFYMIAYQSLMNIESDTDESLDAFSDFLLEMTEHIFKGTMSTVDELMGLYDEEDEDA